MVGFGNPAFPVEKPTFIDKLKDTVLGKDAGGAPYKPYERPDTYTGGAKLSRLDFVSVLCFSVDFVGLVCFEFLHAFRLSVALQRRCLRSRPSTPIRRRSARRARWAAAGARTP